MHSPSHLADNTREGPNHAQEVLQGFSPRDTKQRRRQLLVPHGQTCPRPVKKTKTTKKTTKTKKTKKKTKKKIKKMKKKKKKMHKNKTT